MNRFEKIVEIIFSSIDEINEQQPASRQLEKSEDTVLFGRSGKLDSLGLVNLIIATELGIEEELRAAITLADERAISQENSPFKTVRTFAEYIVNRLEEQPQ